MDVNSALPFESSLNRELNEGELILYGLKFRLKFG